MIGARVFGTGWTAFLLAMAVFVAARGLIVFVALRRVSGRTAHAAGGALALHPELLVCGSHGCVWAGAESVALDLRASVRCRGRAVVGTAQGSATRET